MSRILFVLYLDLRPVGKVFAPSRKAAVATHAHPDGGRVATLAPWVRLVAGQRFRALPASEVTEWDRVEATDYTLAALADANP